MEPESTQAVETPEQKTESTQPEWSWRRYIIKSSIQMAILLMLYVLSIGPFFWEWYASFNSMSSPFFASFYMPLLLACDFIPPLHDGVNWYINLWIS